MPDTFLEARALVDFSLRHRTRNTRLGHHERNDETGEEWYVPSLVEYDLENGETLSLEATNRNGLLVRVLGMRPSGMKALELDAEARTITCKLTGALVDLHAVDGNCFELLLGDNQDDISRVLKGLVSALKARD